MKTTFSRFATPLTLLLILFIGFSLRTFNVDWADGQLPHPDERSTIAFYAPTIHWPKEPGTFFDPRRSTLNPLWDVQANHRRSYTYGHFPLYVLVASGNLTVKLAPVAEAIGVSERIVNMMRIANGSPGYAWVGRVLMALADTLTLFYLFLLGKRMWNEKVGLLAAALGAFTVTQIQLAHFFAVDPISTTFTVAAVYHAIRMVDTGGWKQTVLTGVMAALAIASKFSAAPILAAPGVAGLIIAWQQQRGERKGTPGILLAAAAIGVAVVVFAITSPFVFLDFENFNQAVIKEQGAMVRGEADFPFTRQYRGTTPYLYFIRQQVQWGMGWLLGLVGWLAFAWALVRVALGRTRTSELIVLSWLVPYFGITGAFLAKFNRYMVPVVPFLSVLGAGMLWSFAHWWVRRRARALPVMPDMPVSPPAKAPLHADLPPARPRVIDLAALGERSAQEVQPPAELEPLARKTQPSKPLAAFSNQAVTAQRLFAVLAMVVLLPTVLWALAFVNGVYRSEHPFITASKWMYENIPDGSVWITEHWEEGMPLNLPIPEGYPGAHGWRNVVMPMYEEDTAQKYEIIKQNMREGQYYVLATKRLYGALPHLPERYPMSIRFYELLFSGQLGYELVGDFHTYPSLFGIEINDQNADESFWVYDHPRTLIYKKVRDLSDAEWDALLGGSWESAIPGYTGQRRAQQPTSSKEKSAPTLLLEQPVNALPSVGRVDWNPLRDHSWLMLVWWWLVLAVIQVLAWPLAFTVFSNLRDRGYGFSRALGLLVVAWISWILPSLHVLKNNLLPALLGLLLLLGAAVFLWRRGRQEMLVFVKAHKPLLLLSEGVFSVAFLFFVMIRLLNPDLWQPWQGGEKLMEFAFLNAVLRTPYFPPYDPYFAHGYINYYYYGYQALASLFKLTGVRPSIGFNLAIPTLFAMTAGGVFSLVYSLVPRPRQGEAGHWWQRGIEAGLAGVFFVALMGNLEGGLIVLRRIAEQGHSSFTSNIPLLAGVVKTVVGLGDVLAGRIPLPPYSYWDPSRVIPFTINEFPYWSYLFADLHPHMMGIPFTVLFLALAYNVVATYGRSLFAEGRLAGALALLALPLTLGAIGVRMEELWQDPFPPYRDFYRGTGSAGVYFVSAVFQPLYDGVQYGRGPDLYQDSVGHVAAHLGLFHVYYAQLCVAGGAPCARRCAGAALAGWAAAAFRPRTPLSGSCAGFGASGLGHAADTGHTRRQCAAGGAAGLAGLWCARADPGAGGVVGCVVVPAAQYSRGAVPGSVVFHGRAGAAGRGDLLFERFFVRLWRWFILSPARRLLSHEHVVQVLYPGVGDVGHRGGGEFARPVATGAAVAASLARRLVITAGDIAGAGVGVPLVGDAQPGQ